MKLGLTCISEILKDRDKAFGFQTMTRKRFNSLPRQEALTILGERILHNLKVTEAIVNHCADVGIVHYRFSSALYPLLTDESLSILRVELPNHLDIRDTERKLGKTILKRKISVSIHPDQFNVLCSQNLNVVAKTIRELNFHADFLDRLRIWDGYSTPMNIHIGLSPKPDYSVEVLVKNMLDNINLLSYTARKCLVLENEDKGFWNCENLYQYFHDKLPLTYDNLHDQCNPSKSCYLKKFKSTWKICTPIFHLSEGGKNGNPRAHTDYFSKLTKIPDPDCIWECEVKAKDKAILKLKS